MLLFCGVGASSRGVGERGWPYLNAYFGLCLLVIVSSSIRFLQGTSVAVSKAHSVSVLPALAHCFSRLR